MDTDKVVGYVVTVGGIVVALVAAIVPVLVAIINRRKDDDDETPAPAMGMPVPPDHSWDAWAMLEEKGTLAKAEAQRLLVENGILRQQLTEAHTGWRNTQSDLDEANRRLIAAGSKPVIDGDRIGTRPL